MRFYKVLLVIHQNIYPFGTWWHALNTTREIQEKIKSIDRSKAKKYSWSYSIGPLHCFCISFLEAGASPPPSSVIRFGFPLTFLQIKAPRTQQPHFRRKTVWALSSVPEDFPHIVLSDLDIWIEGFLLKIIKSSSSFSSWITPNLFRFSGGYFGRGKGGLLVQKASGLIRTNCWPVTLSDWSSVQQDK